MQLARNRRQNNATACPRGVCLYAFLGHIFLVAKEGSPYRDTGERILTIAQNGEYACYLEDLIVDFLVKSQVHPYLDSCSFFFKVITKLPSGMFED